MKKQTGSGLDLDYMPYAIVDSLASRVLRGMKTDLKNEGFRNFDIGCPTISGNKMVFTIKDDDGDKNNIEVIVKRKNK